MNTDFDNLRDACHKVLRSIWYVLRFRIVILVLGFALAVAGDVFVGFFPFRDSHYDMVSIHYEDMKKAHIAFERQIERFSAIFDGVPFDSLETIAVARETESTAVNEILEASSYKDAARAYIREIDEISWLIPSLNKERLAYVDAITLLARHYDVTDPPEKDSLEWMIFYGKFRPDYDQYIKARESYFSELANKMGSYWRFVFNS